MPTERNAILSSCRAYRYVLSREWGAGPLVLFVGLNPSTADETEDDPTVRRCVGFANAWGYNRLFLANLFGFRSTKPRELLRATDPVGPENDRYLRNLSRRADLTVAAWGVQGRWHGRNDEVCGMLANLHYLRLTKGGHPSHPLYLPGSLRPKKWTEFAATP
jgi:hypothetical protein